ncbi:ABC transporter substrate-binding protein [Tardiphaga robiniae]|uniref:ABC transporter substrate-binding protein n=1 Tax=Tardiphaga robiniae TaxID=943830 RepID=A0A7G6U1J9_9BRAD|nr:ABC transporter substrate-binding protein [Tardiphaga robiniae]QND72881.1 ABC transporter substrate-binding protein [Tardiphaga robiniae]
MGNKAVLGITILTVAVLFGVEPGAAQKRYDAGASDTEIVIGQVMPYSGPASSWGTIGKAQAAYFKMLNEKGGINGRKIKLISLDDAYSPGKAVEHTRRLVEQDEVLAIFGAFGTASNLAIQQYLNAKKVPQIFLSSGADKWSDYRRFPWTIGWIPTYKAEAAIYARYILNNIADPKVAVLYQNDDYGKDFLRGFEEVLGADFDKVVVAKASYQITDPTIDSQVVMLKASGANILFTAALPKFAAQTIRKVAEIGWKPVHFLNSTAASIAGTLRPAGVENSIGIISAAYSKDPTDPRWKDDAGVAEFKAFMRQYYADGDAADLSNVYGFSVAQTFEQVLRQCGDDLTRENLMRQAAHLKIVSLPMLLPGIDIITGPTDYEPVEKMQLMRFDGTNWNLFGEVIGSSAAELR